MFGFSYLKLIGFAAVFFAVISLGWYVQHIISKNATLELENATLTQVIEDKESEIKLLKNDAVIREVIISNRDKQIQDLQVSYQNIFDSVGGDIDSPAAQSLKDGFDALNGIKKK